MTAKRRTSRRGAQQLPPCRQTNPRQARQHALHHQQQDPQLQQQAHQLKQHMSWLLLRAEALAWQTCASELWFVAQAGAWVWVEAEVESLQDRESHVWQLMRAWQRVPQVSPCESAFWVVAQSPWVRHAALQVAHARRRSHQALILH
jgi:hypothetical protein